MIVNTNRAFHIEDPNAKSTAIPSSVKKNAVFIGASGKQEVGTMDIIKPTEYRLGLDENNNPDVLYFEGQYYETGSYVVGESIEKYTEADAKSEDILMGKNGIVNGKNINGSIYPVSVTDGKIVGYNRSIDALSVSFDSGYYTKTSKININMDDIKNMSGLTPDDIPYGKTILGIDGEFTKNDVDIFPENILFGKVVYCNGKRIVGTLEVQHVKDIQFRVTVDSIILSWINPDKGPYGGIIVKDTNTNEILYTGHGSSSNPGEYSDTTIHNILLDHEYNLEISVFCNPLPPVPIRMLNITT